MDDDQKVAVVTGASSGIGLATALEFAKKGYNLVLAARSEADIQEAATACEEFENVSAIPVVLDTADDAAMHNLAKRAIEAFGKIDVWVNNAAVYLVGKFEDTPLEDMRRLMEVNFFGYVHGSHAALMQFRVQGYGTLISISSINAAAPQPYVGVYSASKAAIRALNESLRMELALDGLSDTIHVCTVMPGSIDTNFFQNGANYSGQEVVALEPVYDPEYAARQIVRLARFPKREIIIGPAARLMALQNALMPSMYERQIAKFTQKDLLSEDHAEPSRGNLYDERISKKGMHGGWRNTRIRADHLNATLAAGTAAAIGVAALVYLLVTSDNDKDKE